MTNCKIISFPVVLKHATVLPILCKQGSCDLGNKPSGFIRCWVAEQLVASQEGLSTMELVRRCTAAVQTLVQER
jgi:hypothetical protein